MNFILNKCLCSYKCNKKLIWTDPKGSFTKNMFLHSTAHCFSVKMRQRDVFDHCAHIFCCIWHIIQHSKNMAPKLFSYKKLLYTTFFNSSVLHIVFLNTKTYFVWNAPYSAGVMNVTLKNVFILFHKNVITCSVSDIRFFFSWCR